MTVESLDTATTLAMRVDNENDDSARILAHALVPDNVFFVLGWTNLRHLNTRCRTVQFLSVLSQRSFVLHFLFNLEIENDLIV